VATNHLAKQSADIIDTSGGAVIEGIRRLKKRMYETLSIVIKQQVAKDPKSVH
jgi:hypothetical protein